jgi:hypothetical protein
MFETIEEVPLDDYFFLKQRCVGKENVVGYFEWLNIFLFFFKRLFSFVREEKVLVDEHSFQKALF